MQVLVALVALPLVALLMALLTRVEDTLRPGETADSAGAVTDAVPPPVDGVVDAPRPGHGLIVLGEHEAPAA